MAFQHANKEIEIEITAIDLQNSVIQALNDEGEGEFRVVFPAKISFAKNGKAKVKFDENGNINYLRMNSAGSFQKKPSFNYSKPFQQAFKPKFQQSNNFQPKPQVHYDSEIKVLIDVPLIDYEKVYNEMAQKTWITASQVFLKPNGNYDVVIYTKVLKDGKRGEYLNGDANASIEDIENY